MTPSKWIRTLRRLSDEAKDTYPMITVVLSTLAAALLYGRGSEFALHCADFAIKMDKETSVVSTEGEN